MADQLPRVTYSNTDIDLDAVHAKFDRDLPVFQQAALGQRHGESGLDDGVLVDAWVDEFSPIDRSIRTGTFPRASAAAIDAAVSLAAEAAVQWGARPPAERVSLLRRFSDLLAERRYDMAFASLFEVGKSRIEAIGEAEEAVDLPRYYADEYEKNGFYRRSLEQVRPDETTESRLIPFGVFAVIAPFNFPVALSVNMISSALLAGNSVVFKPAEGCGLSGRMIVQAAIDAGLPHGVINIVHGDGDVGRQLVAHPLVDGIAFTGSYAVGMQIARTAIAGAYAKPVVAEMGGKNPAYVTASADVAVAAEGVARSAFGLQGQKCSSCSVAYVDDKVYDAFVAALTDFTSRLPIGDPRDRKTFIGAVYNEKTLARFSEAVEEAGRVGRVITGGARVTTGALGAGCFVEPTIVELPAGTRLTTEELFMPFLALRRVCSLEAAMIEGNAVQYGLAAGVFAEDEADVAYFLDHAQAGVVYANRSSGATTGAWPGVQSFCGWKGSGVSHKGGLGPYFLPQFMHEQSRTLIAANARRAG